MSINPVKNHGARVFPDGCVRSEGKINNLAQSLPDGIKCKIFHMVGVAPPFSNKSVLMETLAVAHSVVQAILLDPTFSGHIQLHTSVPISLLLKENSSLLPLKQLEELVAHAKMHMSAGQYQAIREKYPNPVCRAFFAELAGQIQVRRELREDASKVLHDLANGGSLRNYDPNFIERLLSGCGSYLEPLKDSSE